MMHEFDEAPAPDVVVWRRAERERQLKRRLKLDPGLRRDHAGRIALHLEQAIGAVADVTVSLYWPIRGEPDLRPLIERIVAGGGRCALPVVAERSRPLVFRCWSPGDRMERGFWNIPVPAEGAEVRPDIVIAPVVAYDAACFRLGYGGGYFDRTLAEMPEARRVYGVGYSIAAISTIYPQPHDIPMDGILTEDGLLRPGTWPPPIG